MSYNRNSDEALGKNLTVYSGVQRSVEPIVSIKLEHLVDVVFILSGFILVYFVSMLK